MPSPRRPQDPKPGSYASELIRRTGVLHIDSSSSTREDSDGQAAPYTASWILDPATPSVLEKHGRSFERSGELFDPDDLPHQYDILPTDLPAQFRILNERRTFDVRRSLSEQTPRWLYENHRCSDIDYLPPRISHGSDDDAFGIHYFPTLTPEMCDHTGAVAWEDCLPSRMLPTLLPECWCYLSGVARHLRYVVACHYGPLPTGDDLTDELMSEMRDRGMLLPITVIATDGVVIDGDGNPDGDIYHVIMSKSGRLYLDNLHHVCSPESRFGAIPVRPMPEPETPSSSPEQSMRWLMYVTLFLKIGEFVCATRIFKRFWKKVSDVLDRMLESDERHRKFKAAFQEAATVLGDNKFRAEGEPIPEPKGDKLPSESLDPEDSPESESESVHNTIQLTKKSVEEISVMSTPTTISNTSFDYSVESLDLSDFEERWRRTMVSQKFTFYGVPKLVACWLAYFSLSYIYYSFLTPVGFISTCFVFSIFYYELSCFYCVTIYYFLIAFGVSLFGTLKVSYTQYNTSVLLKTCVSLFLNFTDQDTYVDRILFKIPLPFLCFYYQQWALAIIAPSVSHTLLMFCETWAAETLDKRQQKALKKQMLTKLKDFEDSHPSDTETQLLADGTVSEVESDSISESFGRITPPKVLEFLSKHEELPEVPSIGESGNSHEKLLHQLCEQTNIRVVSVFIVQLISTGLPSKVGLARSVAQHSANIASLIMSLSSINKEKTKTILKMIASMTGVVFKAESEGKESEETGGWLSSLASGMESLAKFDMSPVCSVVSEFMGFVITLPILFHDFCSADSFIKMWKVVVKTVKKTGLSLSSIIRGVVGIHTTCVAATVSPNPGETLWEIFKGDFLSTDFIDCQAVMRSLREGTFDPSKNNIQEFRSRLLRLRKKAENQATKPTASALDMNRLDSVNKMLETLTRHIKTSEERQVPFTLSLHGKAGIGKTDLLGHCVDLMHMWVGLQDIQRSSNININIPHDNQTTNATTHCGLDDQGNLTPLMRNAALGAKLNEINQPTYTEVPKADLPDKGVHFYQNVFTTLIDNKPERGIEEEMLEPLAGFRRLGYVVECDLREEYSKDGMFNSEFAKGKNIAFGEHLRFRFYKFVQKDNEPCEMRAESDWLNNQDFFEKLRTHVLAHFEQERERISRKKANRGLKLCNTCSVLPARYCKCGTAFMDCDEKFVAEASVAEYLQAFDLSGVQLPAAYTDRMTMRLVCYLRFLVLGDGYLSKAVDFLSNYPIQHAVLFFLMLVSWTHALSWPTLYTIPVAFIFTCLFAFSLKLVRMWKKMSLHSTTDLVKIHVSNLHSFGNVAYYMTISGLTYLTAATVFKPLCEAFIPETFVAESEPTMDVGAAVVLNKDKDLGVPWKTPLRFPVESLKAPKTTSATDMSVMTGNNEFVGTCVRQSGTRVPVTAFAWNEDYMGMPTHILYENGFGVTQFELYDHRVKREIKFTLYPSSFFVMDKVDYTWIFLPNKELGTVKDMVKYLPLKPGSGLTSYLHIMRDLGNPDVMRSGGMYPVKCVGTEAVCKYWVMNDEVDNGVVLKMSTSITTGSGACGSMYVREESPRVIAAVHTASNKNGVSVAVPLTRAMYECAEKHFAKVACKLPTMQMGPKPTRVLGYLTKIVDQPNRTHPSNFVTDDDRNLEIHGEVVSSHMPRSNVQYCDFLFDSIHVLGAKILEVKPKPKWRETVAKALIPATARKQLADPELLFKAAEVYIKEVQGYAKRFAAQYAEYIDLNAPLSVTNVLNGVPNTPFSCMKTSTSPGFPAKGKKHMYIDEVNGTKVPRAELMESLLKSMRDLMNGVDPGHIASIALKDETVKLVDSEDGPKPKACRGFFPSPLVQHIECSSYLLTQVNIASAYPEVFGTAIGKNREGPDWNEMAKGFCDPVFVNNCADTDYASCDVNQSPQLRTVACSVYVSQAEELGYSEEDLLILKKILSTLVAPVVNMGGTLIRLWNILLSGFLITADLNGKVTMILRRADFLRFWESRNFDVCYKEYIAQHPEEKDCYAYANMGFCNYREHNRDVTLGDDTVVAVSNFMRHCGWTPNHFKETCGMYGMMVTAADKSDDIAFKNFEACEFLKSHTNWHPDLQMNVSVIGPKSYLKPFIANIKGKDWSASVYYADVAENALRSAFFGGRESFDYLFPKMKQWFANTKLPSPLILQRTYEEWVEIMRPEFPQERLFATENRGMQLIEQYNALVSLPFPGDGPFFAESEPVGDGILQMDEGPVDSAGSLHQQIEAERSVEENTTLKGKIDRKVLLITLQWTIGSLDRYEINPYEQMMNQPLFREMFSYIAMWRADLEITFEVTSNNSVAGSLMVSQIFAPESFAPSVTDLGYSRAAVLCYHSQKPHVMIKAGASSGSFVFRVPFVHLAAMCYANDANAISQLCKLTFIEVAPLVSATGHIPASTIKVYGKFVNMITTGATAFERPGPGPSPFFAESEPEEKFSDKMEVAANLLGKVAAVPGMSAMSVPADIARAGAGVAHYLGFGRPVDVAAPVVAPVTAPGFSNMRGNTPGGVLSPDPSQATAPSGQVSGFPEDELQIAEYGSRFSIVDQFTVSTSDNYNAEVWQINVTPAIFHLAATPATDSGTAQTVQPASCAVPTLFFRQWCGSMEYKIEFEMPSATTCRVMFHYDSIVDTHSSGGGISYEEDFVESVNVNIADNPTVYLTVGYTSAFPALLTLPEAGALTPHQFVSKGHAGDDLNGTSSVINGALTTHWRGDGHNLIHAGQLKARIQSKLVTNMGTPLTIRATVYARARPDMEYGVYTGQLPQGSSVVTQASPQTITAAGYVSDEVPPTIVGYAPENVLCVNAPAEVCTIAEGEPTAPTFSGSSAPVSFSPAGLAPPKDTPGPSGGTPTHILPTAKPVSAPTVRPSIAPVTVAPTAGPKTKLPTPSPSTASPSTRQPTTQTPSTADPTTQRPTTLAPSTADPTTARPTTLAPSTADPTTVEPTTLTPSTADPTTTRPTTEEPTTARPTTSAPTTIEPTTGVPPGWFPVTEEPSFFPTTAQPTSAPTVKDYWHKKGLCGIISWNKNPKRYIGLQFFGERDYAGVVRLEGARSANATLHVPSFVQNHNNKPVAVYNTDGGIPPNVWENVSGAPITEDYMKEGRVSDRNKQHLVSDIWVISDFMTSALMVESVLVSIPHLLKYAERPPFGLEKWALSEPGAVFIPAGVTIASFPSFGEATVLNGIQSGPVHGMQWPGGPQYARNFSWLPNDPDKTGVTNLTEPHDWSAAVAEVLAEFGCTVVYGNVTYIGTIVVVTDLETKTFESQDWACGSFKYTYGTDVQFDTGTTSWIRSWGFLTHVESWFRDTNGTQDWWEKIIANKQSGRSLMNLAQKFFAEAEPVIQEEVSFHLGSKKPKDDFFQKVLTGEVHVSFRTLMKVPHRIYTLQLNLPPGAQGASTFQSFMWLDSDETDLVTPFQYLLYCYNGMKGGIVNHYHIIGDGTVEVTKMNRHAGGLSVLGATGTEIIDSRTNPHFSVKFPCQSTLEYSYAKGYMKTPPNMRKDVTIHGWNGNVKVRVFRSTAEDFSFMIFSGAAPFHIRTSG